MWRTHPREGRLSTDEGADHAIDDPAVRLAYRQLIAAVDPARAWLDGGAVDARFGGVAPLRSVVRGPGDLTELHDLIDDLFGVGLFARPPQVLGGSELVRAELPITRPAAVIPFIETLRPRLDGRGPAFWTWKSAREAAAVRLQSLGALTIEAVRT